MATYEQKELSGALFKHDKKGNEKAPDYKGNCKIGGKEWEMAAWLKTSPKGTKYMSLSFGEPFKKTVKDDAPRNSGFDDIPDDIPF